MCIHVERMRTHTRIMRCAADLWMNHEEQAAAVDSQPWKRSTSTQDIGESTACDSAAMRFQGASALLSSPVWSLALG
jgi:hypothetical protein